MVSTRIIPCLLLEGQRLVKTRGFKDPVYVGDPRNAVRIFNEREVDELVLLDIAASREKRDPQYQLIEEITSEAFMPIAYGGGVNALDKCARLFSLGIEKVVVNTEVGRRPDFATEMAQRFGSQSVVVSLDVRRKLFGSHTCMIEGGRVDLRARPSERAAQAEALGAGELLVTSIGRDGTQEGYDLDLVRSVSSATNLPVVACGGAGSLQDMADVVHIGGASAAAAGSIFVFHGKHRAVLISYPERSEIKSLFPEQNSTGGET